jgi:hypothetical protein
MTAIGTPELVLVLVALGGMTAAAIWGAIELTNSTKMNDEPDVSILNSVKRARYIANEVIE